MRLRRRLEEPSCSTSKDGWPRKVEWNYLYALAGPISMTAIDFDSILTVDGASGTGKTTLLRGLADRFDYVPLELGPVVRAVAWLIVHERRTTTAAIALLDALGASGRLQIDRAAAGTLSASEVQLDGFLPRQRAFSSTLGIGTAAVATDAEAMEWIYALVRVSLRCRRVVVSARNGASRVCPEARLQILLTASPEVRSKRKRQQLSGAGLGYGWLDDAVLLEGPEPGQLVIDTTALTADQVLEVVSAAIEREFRWRALTFGAASGSLASLGVGAQQIVIPCPNAQAERAMRRVSSTPDRTTLIRGA